LSAGFTKNYWYPIRDRREELKPQRGRDASAACPRLPAVEEMAGQDIYRLRHLAKEILDEAGGFPLLSQMIFWVGLPSCSVTFL
jgi:hypothetical protein